MKSTSCQRRDDNKSKDNRLDRTYSNARDQDGWDQLNQTVFVTNPPFPLSLRGSVLVVDALACTHARALVRDYSVNSLRGTNKSSLSLSVWFVRTSGRRHARLTVAAMLIERSVRPKKLKSDCYVIYYHDRNRFLALGCSLALLIEIKDVLTLNTFFIMSRLFMKKAGKCKVRYKSGFLYSIVIFNNKKISNIYPFYQKYISK